MDFDLMRRQPLAFGDLVLAVDDVPRGILAGADSVYRPGQSLHGPDPLGEAAAPGRVRARRRQRRVGGPGG